MWMIVLWGDIVTVALLGLIVLRKGRDRFIGRSRLANWLMIVGLVALGLQGTINLIFVMGEVTNGGMGDATHLVSVAVTVILGVLVWRRPLEGGMGVLILGVLRLIVYRPVMLMMNWPLALCGLFILVSAVLGRRATASLYPRKPVR